ncbi:hypothetical protein EWM64_g3594 [Hericium alpestre]|uniref:Amino acid transporter transmembrane domain-containing protein n=1 Tax=Hericium alpestre TaxID=135208 RepID=A0A4Z0A016_9AGAM|nr:hypothetical protein EWM64_g3594 [Hericium alpestre]
MDQSSLPPSLSLEKKDLEVGSPPSNDASAPAPPKQDVFVDDENHQIHYKTLSWQFVSMLMIAEIMSNGMLSLPNAVAVVGLVPSIILTIFLGIFGLFTAKLLIDFKLNHPHVHTMGDAGLILFGPVGREILSAGTIIFAIFALTFAYAGHFMFFILISEMKRPQDAMKAAWCLQVGATTLYVVFSVVIYVYLGSTVQSPALFSLPPKWAKAAFGIGLVNFLLAGALYAHTASKLVFIRFFRHSRHVYTHTILGWSVWTFLCFLGCTAAFILAVAVPIFSDLIGIAASLFASWYTYGLAGFFWLYDTYHLKGGEQALKRRWKGTTLAIATIIAGSFICVAGTYVSIKLIVDAYKSGTVGKPFTC